MDQAVAFDAVVAQKDECLVVRFVKVEDLSVVFLEFYVGAALDYHRFCDG